MLKAPSIEHLRKTARFHRIVWLNGLFMFNVGGISNAKKPKALINVNTNNKNISNAYI